MTIDEVREITGEIIRECNRVIVGKEEILSNVLIAMLSNGHVILEGVPGLAKTYMARTFASILGCAFKRIQLTVDTLPADLLGSNVFNQRTGEFWFRKGPVFANLVLADEINRCPPKSQSALLEVMEERQVSIEGVTRKLPKPFLIIATQNPVEQEGTYPLPEAQLDRFMFRLILDYPTGDEEAEVIRRKHIGEAADLRVLADPTLMVRMQNTCKTVFIEEDIINYIRDIVIRTRNNPQILLGGSPRASLVLMNASKARAAMNGRDYVTPEDVRKLSVQTLNHRLVLKPEAELEGLTVERVVSKILGEVDCPR
ncbi:MAG: magnesium chelatase [Candidatus Thorarchaeota archaeon]|nr:MAG: magnesium chelatase [Candidatus Thorarchaeota archaeon]RLI59929.1 MAG: magnesium chelatase [Candidatus Thorarchaeota archaeon]